MTTATATTTATEERTITRRKLALRRVDVQALQAAAPAPAAPPAPAPHVSEDARRLDAALARVRALLVDDEGWRGAVDAALAAGEQVHVRVVLQRKKSGLLKAHVDCRAVRPLRGASLGSFEDQPEAENDPSAHAARA